MITLSNRNGHRWKFFRAGGLDQVTIRSGTDIANIEHLDQKLWAALSCPTRGIEFDPKTLELFDADKDGRIRAGELIAAIRWTVQHLKNPDDLLKAGDALPLDAINDQTESGAKLLSGAKRILVNLGKAGANSVSAADTTDTKRVFAQTKFNGDGVVPVDSSDDPEIRKIIEEIIASQGGETDRSGKPGINKAKLDAFFAQAQAVADWSAKPQADAAILPLGEATASAAAAVRTVRPKIDDYFARCRLAAFDKRAIGPLNRAESDFISFAAKDLTIGAEEIAKLPLARIEPGKPLSLDGDVNPAWAGPIARFKTVAAKPVLGGDAATLTEEDWSTLVGRFAAFEAWNAAKPVTALEKLGAERVRAILASNAKETIGKLISEDVALEVENAQINAVDKLVRFYRDLNRLLHNFVNLADFYDPRYIATFQIGRLYMDGRACDLCFHVDDIAKHSTLAGPSRIYLAYCDVLRPASNQKRTICAAFTSGFAETLWVGRNGIFYDRQGNDWEAVIVKVVENSISLKEAFWAPWKKIAAMISDQFKKILAAREAAALSAASKSVEQIGKTADPAKPPALAAVTPPPQPGRLDGAAVASSVAAIGIAVGLLSSAAAKVVELTGAFDPFQIILWVFGIILAVSGPSVVLAYFKLRARDLAPVLNACGWAVNSRIRMTLALGRELTQEAKLPPGTERALRDPYAESYAGRNWTIGLLVVLMTAYCLYKAWSYRWLDRLLPERMDRKTYIEKKEGQQPVPNSSTNVSPSVQTNQAIAK